MEWRLIGMSFVGVIGLAYKFVWFLMSNGGGVVLVMNHRVCVCAYRLNGLW